MSATLLHGDSLKILPTLQGVDAVVTDPPYGTDVPRDGYGRRQLGGRHIANDDSLAVVSSLIPLLPRILKPHAWIVLFCSPKNRFPFESICRGSGLNIVGEVVWDKARPGLGGGIRYQHETILLCSFGKPKGKSGLLSVLKGIVSRNPRPSHPHEKPVEVMEKLTRYSSSEGDTVLGPFMGSGTTGVACLRTGRHFIGIEQEAAYVEIARRRIAEEEGKHPLFQGVKT